MSAPEDALAAAEKALEGAAEAVEKLLERPDKLLDPESAEAHDVAEGARSFMKVFFDAAQARCPPAVQKAAAGLTSLVVDGFDAEQIWEELEVQNVPLRRHLRQHVKRLTEGPQGAVSIELEPPAKPVQRAAPPPKAAQAPRNRRRAAKPARGAKGVPEVQASEDDEEEDDYEESQKQEKAAPKDEPGGLEDEFFSLEEMNKFADLADKPGAMMLDDEEDEDFDFGLLEDGDDEDNSKTAKFSDFFSDVSKGSKSKSDKVIGKEKRQKKSSLELEEEEGGDEEAEEEEEEEDEAGLEDVEDIDELSDQERELEEAIKKLQAEGAGDEGDDDDEEEEEEDEDVAGSNDEENEEKEPREGGKKSKVKEKSLYEMDKRLQALEEEVAKLEEEQLEEKHWSLRGEVSAKERPLNSLLEVHLDQPMTQLAGSRASDSAAAAGLGGGEEDALDDVPGADAVAKAVGFDVEAIIRQRIWDETFDDVIRRTELPPSQRPQGAEQDAADVLNFQKSRIGLGDVYAQQYEAEMLGHKTEAEVKEDKDKTETKALFAKLMYKLDQLTNAHFTPRPPMLGVSGEQLAKVPSLKMEETIPLMVSDASLKAPEELRAPRRHDRERNELNHEERGAARRAKKVKRRRALEKKVEAGEMTLAGMREREQKLSEKNAAAKREKANVGVVKDVKKRLRASELLAQAAENASSGISRKEEIRRERQQRPEGAPTSKRLKL